jgi:hypothetical protein
MVDLLVGIEMIRTGNEGTAAVDGRLSAIEHDTII